MEEFGGAVSHKFTRPGRAATLAVLLSTLAYHNPARGQGTTATLLVELQNVVEYQVDTYDLSKFGTDPNVTKGGNTKGLGPLVVSIGDVVAVNGDPAKGTYISQAALAAVRPDPVPGGPIGDTSWNTSRYETYEILQPDGTPVGTLMTSGLNAGSPSPPGPPAGTQNFAIVGGTGAFFGARGQKGGRNALLNGAVTPRIASITEDPSRRRQNGGGHILSVLYVVPMFRPEIVATANGPAVTHSNDFSLVTASKPAAPGEILSVFATGLGPTRTSLDPGQPFPSSPLAVLNSPLAVTVNGESAEVLGAVGYPGSVDGYQVNFRLPSNTGKGTVSLQLTAAWIPGAPVSIPVQ